MSDQLLSHKITAWAMTQEQPDDPQHIKDMILFARVLESLASRPLPIWGRLKILATGRIPLSNLKDPQ